jgi:hypothetical protein
LRIPREKFEAVRRRAAAAQRSRKRRNSSVAVERVTIGAAIAARRPESPFIAIAIAARPSARRGLSSITASGFSTPASHQNASE